MERQILSIYFFCTEVPVDVLMNGAPRFAFGNQHFPFRQIIFAVRLENVIPVHAHKKFARALFVVVILNFYELPKGLTAEVLNRSIYTFLFRQLHGFLLLNELRCDFLATGFLRNKKLLERVPPTAMPEHSMDRCYHGDFSAALTEFCPHRSSLGELAKLAFHTNHLLEGMQYVS